MTHDFHGIARAVAEHLPGFSYIDDRRQKNADGEYYSVAMLTSTDGAPHPMQITFGSAPTYAQRSKLYISLHSPHVKVGGNTEWLGQALGSSKLKVGIHVDPSRDPKALAKEIARRLLPEANAQWTVMLAWLADQEAYALKAADTHGVLSSAGVRFGTSNPTEGYITAGDVHVSLNVSGESVQLGRMTVTAEQALRVLQALRG